MLGSGCRAGGPLDRAAAAERELEDVGVAVGARLGGIIGRMMCGVKEGVVEVGEYGIGGLLELRMKSEGA